jgi:HlyD family secretion protein
MKRLWKRVLYALVAVMVMALVALALVPDPVKVEIAAAQSGPLAVTVDEDGETRARDRYVIAAPVAGRVSRIDLRDGDPVALDQPVAEVWPLPLSAREREEQLARIAAAEAGLREAQSRVRRAAADHAQKRRERERVEDLVRNKFVSPQAAEQARLNENTAADDLQAARERARAAAADLQSARAARLAIEAAKSGGSVTLRSPVTGRVLRIPERSERVVAAGTALMTVGDPQRLEVVVDLLSQDAVKVRPGMPVLLEGWGGGKALRARVRTVEPFAFTKVSALGVEEQRVNVVADFVDPPGPLGDGYRVEARTVVWSADNVLKVPASALFRDGGKWNVFVMKDGRARLRGVEVGQRNSQEAEIRSGLREGENVVRHPSNALKDGARVKV